MWGHKAATSEETRAGGARAALSCPVCGLVTTILSSPRRLAQNACSQDNLACPFQCQCPLPPALSLHWKRPWVVYTRGTCSSENHLGRVSHLPSEGQKNRVPSDSSQCLGHTLGTSHLLPEGHSFAPFQAGAACKRLPSPYLLIPSSPACYPQWKEHLGAWTRHKESLVTMPRAGAQHGVPDRQMNGTPLPAGHTNALMTTHSQRATHPQGVKSVLGGGCSQLLQ